MEIFPAIDLKEGACVRLEQGDFDKATVYEQDPVAQAQKFADAGATWLHLVDLDGAKDPSKRQTDLIHKIVASTSLSVEVGGGIRTKDDARALLEAGAKRVVVGSLAIEQLSGILSLIKEFGGDKVVVAFDIRQNSEGVPVIVTKGWQEDTKITLWEALEAYRKTDLKNIMCTDVSCDGMMTGPNLELYKIIQQRVGSHFSVLASGGISGLQDIRDLVKTGVAGAISGRALYEGKLDLVAAVQAGKEC